MGPPDPASRMKTASWSAHKEHVLRPAVLLSAVSRHLHWPPLIPSRLSALSPSFEPPQRPLPLLASGLPVVPRPHAHGPECGREGSPAHKRTVGARLQRGERSLVRRRKRGTEGSGQVGWIRPYVSTACRQSSRQRNAIGVGVDFTGNSNRGMADRRRRTQLTQKV